MDPEAQSAPPIRVVVVDDHQLFREGLRELLEEEGFEVAGEASDGAMAVRLVRDLAPDVTVMDLNMPKMTGVEAVRAIRENSPTTRVMMLTVSPADDDVAEAIVAGACGYLLKDASVEEIVEGIRAAARGESLLDPAVAERLLERLRGEAVTPAERPHLTAREAEVLRLVAAGKDNRAIAAELFVSPQTVKNHVSNLLQKLQVDNRIQAAVQAVRRGLA